MRPFHLNPILLTLFMGGATAMTAQDFGDSIPKDNGKGEVTAGATYSSLHGAVALIGLEGTNLGGSGVDLALNLRRGKTGQGGTARLRYGRDLGTEKLGQDAKLFFGAEYNGANWDDEAYQSQTRKLSFGLSARAGQSFGYAAKLFWQKDSLSGLGATASPLVTAEQGDSTAAGLAFDGQIGHMEGGVLPVAGASLDLGLSWAGLGERKTNAVYAAATMAHALDSNKVLVLRAEAGRIAGLDGQSVGMLDRAYLGGAGGPRGFAFGSIGPRDFVAGSVDTPLGGRRYSMLSTELRTDVNEKLSVGVFADAGAVWDLGGAQTGAMGAIDDSRIFRASGGVSFYWDTAIGKLNLSLAKPLQIQENDSFNQVSLGLLRSF